MSVFQILVAVQIVAFVGDVPAQSIICKSATSDETLGLREDVVRWVSGSDPQVVAKRNALQLLAATPSQVNIVTQTNKCQQAASAYHSYLLPGSPPISRSMIVIKIANNRYVIQDPAELQGEFGSVLITDGSFNVLAKISA